MQNFWPENTKGEKLAEEVDEEESLAIFGDIDVAIATQDTRAKEQSTDVLPHDDLHVSVRHSGPVKLEALSYTLPFIYSHSHATCVFCNAFREIVVLTSSGNCVRHIVSSQDHAVAG